MSSNLSRRSFLKGAAALAVVSAASGVLAGCSSIGVSGSAVSGTGAVRTFTDGETTITITNTAFDMYSLPSDSTTVTIPGQSGSSSITLPASAISPSFKVDNKTKADLFFVDSVNNVKDSGYSMVTTASFDGKQPASQPGTAATIGSTNLADFSSSAASANKTTEGILTFAAPFKNWNSVVITMTLYKKDKDNNTVKVGTATYNFRQ